MLFQLCPMVLPIIGDLRVSFTLCLRSSQDTCFIAPASLFDLYVRRRPFGNGFAHVYVRLWPSCFSSHYRIIPDDELGFTSQPIASPHKPWLRSVRTAKRTKDIFPFCLLFPIHIGYSSELYSISCIVLSAITASLLALSSVYICGTGSTICIRNSIGTLCQ